jgi:hypothetical protein
VEPMVNVAMGNASMSGGSIPPYSFVTKNWNQEIIIHKNLLKIWGLVTPKIAQKTLL